MKYNEHIANLQRAGGMTGNNIDGKRGPKTDVMILNAADEGRLTIAPPLVIIKDPAVKPPKGLDLEPQTKLAGVHPALVQIVEEAGKRSDVGFDVIEGLRTAKRQAELVKAGASKTHDSRHLTGHAVDLWPTDLNGKRFPSDAAFPRGSAAARSADKALWDGLRKIAAVMKEVAREQGVLLEWGGDWGWDAPHFQLNRAAFPK